VAPGSELGLRFVTIDREEIGGTVARYPRRKLVMTQPVHLPLHGRLRKTSYVKEELIELWRDIAARHRLPIETGVEYTGVERDAGETFRVRTTAGEYPARNVCLALGRRGTPRKLGVPGEQLPKVTYGSRRRSPTATGACSSSAAVTAQSRRLSGSPDRAGTR
jgi:glycine/D-amino acid oxidase-like deaminating enzyme